MNKMALFITVIFMAAFSLSCARNDSFFGDENLQVLHEKTFQISPGKTLKVNTSSGNIEIITWDKNEVYARILGNERAMKKVEFTFNNDENIVEITAKTKNSFLGFVNNSGIKMKFEIRVPKNFNPIISTAGGNIALEDLTGDPRLTTSGGNIYVKNSSGNIKTNTSGGEIRVENVSGNINLSTSGGDIVANQFTGDFEANTSGGNIKLIGSDSKIFAETSGGNIRLDYLGKNKGIELSTSGGNVDINLPVDFNASAKLSTSGGHVSCDFTLNNAIHVSSSKLEADLNSGGFPLIAKTSGGNISVNKK